MYIQQISIKIKSKKDSNELVDEFNLLMAFYRGNGQVQGKIQSEYIKDNKIESLPYTLEKNSLNKKYNNFYVNRQSKKIEELCNSKLEYRTLGKSYENYKTPCTCKSSGFYILTTNYVSIASPLTCGDCNKSVPLYKLPVYYDHGYMPILSWESNYISCDTLQMNCQVGEVWALKQMEDLKSQLSKQGLKICRKIEELTSIPTYYYLYNYVKFKGDNLSRPCPNCGKRWGLKKQLHKYYDFKCDKCKLVSTISPNS